MKKDKDKIKHHDDEYFTFTIDYQSIYPNFRPSYPKKDKYKDILNKRKFEYEKSIRRTL